MVSNSNIASGQGIGRMVVDRLAKDGNTLHCVDISETHNEQMKEDLKVILFCSILS